MKPVKFNGKRRSLKQFEYYSYCFNKAYVKKEVLTEHEQNFLEQFDSYSSKIDREADLRRDRELTRHITG